MRKFPLFLGQVFLLIGIVGLPGLAFTAERADRPEWNLGDSWSYARTAYPTARSTTTSKTNYTIAVTEKTLES
jgi:hypothetical protein